MDRNAANPLFLGPIDRGPGDQRSAPRPRPAGGGGLGRGALLQDGGRAGGVSGRPTNHPGAVSDGGGSNHTGECIISAQLPSVSLTRSHLTETHANVKYDTLSEAGRNRGEGAPGGGGG